MGKRAGLLANGLTDNKDLKDEQTQKNTDKLDELNVRGGELLFGQLILRANTTLSATIILFLSFLSLFFNPPIFWEIFYII